MNKKHVPDGVKTFSKLPGCGGMMPACLLPASHQALHPLPPTNVEKMYHICSQIRSEYDRPPAFRFLPDEEKLH